jgi:hypothetical protein
VSAADQTFAQSAFTAELPFHALHESIIALVIVPQEVEQTVQSQDAPFSRLRMARRTSLPAGGAARNGYVGGRKAEHVRDFVDTTKAAVQRLDFRVADERDAHNAPRPGRRDAPQPGRETTRRDRTAAAVRDQDA